MDDIGYKTLPSQSYHLMPIKFSSEKSIIGCYHLMPIELSFDYDEFVIWCWQSCHRMLTETSFVADKFWQSGHLTLKCCHLMPTTFLSDANKAVIWCRQSCHLMLAKLSPEANKVAIQRLQRCHLTLPLNLSYVGLDYYTTLLPVPVICYCHFSSYLD
jgi:hypothetical protein